jgi:hypothetical protein
MPFLPPAAQSASLPFGFVQLRLWFDGQSLHNLALIGQPPGWPQLNRFAILAARSWADQLGIVIIRQAWLQENKVVITAARI